MSHNCMCCGKQLCKKCSRFKAHLDFLGYSHNETVCYHCKIVIVTPIKSEIKEEVSGKVRKSVNFTERQSNLSVTSIFSLR